MAKLQRIFSSRELINKKTDSNYILGELVKAGFDLREKIDLSINPANQTTIYEQ